MKTELIVRAWVVFVAIVGAFIFAFLREKITDQGVWLLWGVFVGGIGVAGGILLLEATK